RPTNGPPRPSVRVTVVCNIALALPLLLRQGLAAGTQPVDVTVTWLGLDPVTVCAVTVKLPAPTALFANSVIEDPLVNTAAKSFVPSPSASSCFAALRPAAAIYQACV